MLHRMAFLETIMKLNQAKIIVQEPRYVEAQRVIAEADAADIETEIADIVEAE